MPRAALILMAGVLIAVATLVAPSHLAVDAAGGDPNPTITASVSTPGSSTPGTPGSSSTLPPCWWTSVGATDDSAEALNVIVRFIQTFVNAFGVTMIVTVVYYSEGNQLHRYNEGNGEYEGALVRVCTDSTDPSDGSIIWVVNTPPDPAILLPGATQSATSAIEVPAPDISPPDASAVNLGLWLAVEPAGPIVVRAELGRAVWAQTTAALATTTYDLGNGDEPVVCTGNGSPIPETEKDSIAEGPCGYTYRESTDGETVSLTVTATWTITWELSDGRTGSEPDVVVSTVLPYEVYEIQTIGTRG